MIDQFIFVSKSTYYLCGIRYKIVIVEPLLTIFERGVVGVW